MVLVSSTVWTNVHAIGQAGQRLTSTERSLRLPTSRLLSFLTFAASLVFFSFALPLVGFDRAVSLQPAGHGCQASPPAGSVPLAEHALLVLLTRPSQTGSHNRRNIPQRLPQRLKISGLVRPWCIASDPSFLWSGISIFRTVCSSPSGIRWGQECWQDDNRRFGDN